MFFSEQLFLVFTPRSVRPEAVLSSPLCAAMVQHIEFIQTFNPSQEIILPKVNVIGQGQKFKKKLLTR